MKLFYTRFDDAPNFLSAFKIFYVYNVMNDINLSSYYKYIKIVFTFLIIK